MMADQGSSSDTASGVFQMDAVYRYARPLSAEPAVIDGLPNFFAQIHSPGMKKATLEKGINCPAAVRTAQGLRRAMILISSSPHKVGTRTTPWEDIFEPERGFVRYFGDNKSSARAAEGMAGNELLLAELPLHCSSLPQERLRATPLLVFRRVSWDGRKKGNVQFAGVAVIERAERAQQVSRSTGESFGNFVFDLAILSLEQEHDCLDCSWLLARRDGGITTEATMDYAPAAWREWVKRGHEALPQLRRYASKSSR